jgi:ferritin-like metal-binding protein YciE
MSAQENLVAWLRDARAMESQAIEMLEKQVSRLDDYPQLKTRVQQHLVETQGQADMLDRCLERYDTGRSVLKEAASKFTGTMQAILPTFASDEVVKGSVASYAFEHFEIGNYRALIAAAEQCGDSQTATTLRQILGQEEAMASWLEQHLGPTTQEFLRRDAAEQARP